MNLIEKLNPEAFVAYLREYQNTICGRHPISVFLQSIVALQKQKYDLSFKFLRYAQSNHVERQNDSSVSYASGSLILNWEENLEYWQNLIGARTILLDVNGWSGF